MLSEDQKALGAMLEQMEPAQVREVLDFARKLRQEQLDYSDTWSDEDIEDWRRSGLEHMEKVCPNDDDPLAGAGDAQPR